MNRPIGIIFGITGGGKIVDYLFSGNVIFRTRLTLAIHWAKNSHLYEWFFSCFICPQNKQVY